MAQMQQSKADSAPEKLRGRKVTLTVHAHHPETGDTRILNPGDTVPDGYAVGDHAFVEQERTFVNVPGFGQVDVHELRRAQMAANGGVTDEERDALAEEDNQTKAQARAAVRRVEAAGFDTQRGRN